MDSATEIKNNKKKIKYICIRCEYAMKELSVCHLKCFRCGSEYDCSDKGNFW